MGAIRLISIMVLPKKAPFDLPDNYWTKKYEVKLFARRALVANKLEELSLSWSQSRRFRQVAIDRFT